MAKAPNVGSSWHTRAKHRLVWQFVAREVSAANHPKLWFERLAWYDLTAGDAIPAYEAEWHTACSPGILAYHATQSRKPVGIALYERNSATYEKLLASLAEHLPQIGYEQIGPTVWRFEDSLLWAHNADGSTARTTNLKRNDAVLVLNDPNAITEWAMRSGFAKQIRQRASGLRILSTLGCNVNGIKRAPYARDTLDLGDGSEVMPRTERRAWFGLVDEQVLSLPRHQDMLLTSFERDRDQWAYLLWQPDKPRWRNDAEADVRAAFAAVGRPGLMAWYRTDERRFKAMKEKLFLTQPERDARANTPFPESELDGDE